MRDRSSGSRLLELSDYLFGASRNCLDAQATEMVKAHDHWLRGPPQATAEQAVCLLGSHVVVPLGRHMQTLLQTLPEYKPFHE